MTMFQGCERCGNNRPASTTTSFFSMETICGQCCDEERQAPGFEAARAAEVAACKAGNYNFGGVGLSAEDRRFLAELRARRAPRPEAGR
jgi:hypothetical protein